MNFYHVKVSSTSLPAVRKIPSRVRPQDLPSPLLGWVPLPSLVPPIPWTAASTRSVHVLGRQVLEDGESRELLLKGQPIFNVEGYTTELYGVMIPHVK